MPTVEAHNISKLIDSPIAKPFFERARKVYVEIDPDNNLVILGVQRNDDFKPYASSKSNRG